MPVRNIVTIDAGKCTGCGLCVDACAEGAIEPVNGKATVVKEEYCDGLGACLPACPADAIKIEQREAAAFDEEAAMDHVAKTRGQAAIVGGPAPAREPYIADGPSAAREPYIVGGPSAAREDEHRERSPRGTAAPASLKPLRASPPTMGNAAHAEHVRHVQAGSGGPGAQLLSFAGGCPGAAVRDARGAQPAAPSNKFEGGTQAPPSNRFEGGAQAPRQASALSQWPVQLGLIPPHAPFLKNADVVLTADCVPFAYADYHRDFLAGKAVLVACPKLDDLHAHAERLEAIVRDSGLRSLTVVRMEVPCCSALARVAQSAIAQSGREAPFNEVVISIGGERL